MQGADCSAPQGNLRGFLLPTVVIDDLLCRDLLQFLNLGRSKVFCRRAGE
jgi:hypothetical protein